MSDWIRVESETTHHDAGNTYYINLANVAAVHLFIERPEHERHLHAGVSVITTGGAVVKIAGEEARDEVRRALDRRQQHPEVAQPGNEGAVPPHVD